MEWLTQPQRMQLLPILVSRTDLRSRILTPSVNLNQNVDVEIAKKLLEIARKRVNFMLTVSFRIKLFRGSSVSASLKKQLYRLTELEANTLLLTVVYSGMGWSTRRPADVMRALIQLITFFDSLANTERTESLLCGLPFGYSQSCRFKIYSWIHKQNFSKNLITKHEL